MRTTPASKNIDVSLVVLKRNFPQEKTIFDIIHDCNDDNKTKRRSALNDLRRLIQQDPEVLSKTHPIHGNPIFYAISDNNIDALSLIIDEHPQALDYYKPQFGLPIFFAIRCKNIEALKCIISKKPECLNHENFDSQSPIFFAINSENIDAVEYIISQDKIILQTDKNGYSPLEYAVKTLTYNLLNNDNEKIKTSKLILNTIFKKQFNTTKNITDKNLELLTDFLDNFSHLKLGYGSDDFGLFKGMNIEIYKKLLKQISDSSITREEESQDFQKIFTSSAQKTLDSVNSFQKPIITDNEKLYIFESGLIDHSSYFVFHVDKENNNVLYISYCDGNKITFNNFRPENTNYLMGGVKKFKVESEIKFSEKFVKNFLELNSMNREFKNFYDQFKENGLPVYEDSQAIKDLKISNYSIVAKSQLRGNCTYKSLKILWRYIAELENPMIQFMPSEINTFYENIYGFSDENEMAEEIVDGASIFKDFKGKLTILAIENLIKIKQSLDEESSDKELFKDFLIQKINQTLIHVRKKSEMKIELLKTDPNKQDELNIHERIKELSSISFDYVDRTNDKKAVDELSLQLAINPALTSNSQSKIISSVDPKNRRCLPSSCSIS